MNLKIFRVCLHRTNFVAALENSLEAAGAPLDYEPTLPITRPQPTPTPPTPYQSQGPIKKRAIEPTTSRS